MPSSDSHPDRSKQTSLLMSSLRRVCDHFCVVSDDAVATLLRWRGRRSNLTNEQLFPQTNIIPGVIGGRNPLEGHQRGWGLQFGKTNEYLMSDPLYRAARTAGRSSILTEARLQNLFLLITRFFTHLPDHNIIEFGSYRGGSAIFMAYILRELYPNAKLFALDTFSGNPQSDATVDSHQPGDFSNSQFDKFHEKRDRLGLTNLIICRGLFADTLPTIVAENQKFALAHIDCDTRNAVAYCEASVWPHMVPGGYLVFDDANASSCLGATEAVELMIHRRKIHCEQAWPHLVFRSGLESRAEPPVHSDADTASANMKYKLEAPTPE